MYFLIKLFYKYKNILSQIFVSNQILLLYMYKLFKFQKFLVINVQNSSVFLNLLNFRFLGNPELTAFEKHKKKTEYINSVSFLLI